MAAQVEFALFTEASLPPFDQQPQEEELPKVVSSNLVRTSSNPRDLFDRYMADVKKTALLPADELKAIARESYRAKYEILKVLSDFPPCAEALAEQYHYHREKGFQMGNFLDSYGDQSLQAKDALAEANERLGKDAVEDAIEDEELRYQALKTFSAYVGIYQNAEPHVRRSSCSAVRKHISSTFRFFGLRHDEFVRQCKIFEDITYEVQRFADMLIEMATCKDHLTILDKLTEDDIDRIARRIRCEDRQRFHVEATRLCRRLDAIGLSLRECTTLRSDYQHHKTIMETQNNRIVEANLLLAAREAIRQRPEDDRLFDVCQEANEGLMQAAMRFAYWKGFAFSTYACQWIGQRLGREKARTHNSDFPIPFSIATRAAKICKIREEHGEYMGEQPLSVSEIAKKANCTVAQVDEVSVAYNALTNCEMVAAAVPCDSGDASTFAEQENLKAVVHKALARMPQPKQDICRQRWGIGSTKTMTLQQLASEYDLTIERVRKIEMEGLKFLRSCSYSDSMRELYASL